MSRGALLQLVAKNEIDDYLIDSDLKSSPFQNTIKKTTNFSESPCSFYPTGNCTWGDTIRFTVKRMGDLITQMYLVLNLPALSVKDIYDAPPSDQNEIDSTLRVKWNNYIGNTIIEYVTLRIGGQIIDKLTGEYLQINTEIFDSGWSKMCMIGQHSSLTAPQTRIDEQYIYIPLRFFFCTDTAKALPIIALEYHEVEVEVKLRTWHFTYLVLKQIDDVDIKSDGSTTTQVSKKNFQHTAYHITQKTFNDIRLDCNFIFLDGEERVNMAKKRHEILITQTQQLHIAVKSTDPIYLNFTNPIKELFFVFQRTDYAELGELFNFSGKPMFIPMKNDLDSNITQITDRLWNQIPDAHLLDTLSIEFNGIERVPVRDYKYWHYVQNYENYKARCDSNIYMYSFGLNSKENMGSCNFSMLDTVRLNVRLAVPDPGYGYLVQDVNTVTVGTQDPMTISVYGNNYNIFVIESGMGGLMYTI